MTLPELQTRARTIADRYQHVNSAAGRPNWTASDYMAGFVGDVGELSQLVMAKANLRPMDNVDDRLAHELADCLWSLLILSDQLGVDLEASFTKTMTELDTRLDQLSAQS
jgi:NTP pyrophosphatase (non-canonical NTP hydrolase)